MIALPEETGRIHNMFDYKNEVVLQTAHGVFRLDSKLGRVEKLPWDLRGHVLTYDEKEDEFWTMDENTLYKEKLEDGKFECRTILNDVFIRQVLLDSEGNAWLASDGRGLYKYFIQDFIKCSSENMRSVMAVTKDHDGTTWIGTIGKGLWSIKKGKTNHYDTKNPKTLYRNNIQCLVDDVTEPQFPAQRNHVVRSPSPVSDRFG
jgi:hypothetical protein